MLFDIELLEDALNIFFLYFAQGRCILMLFSIKVHRILYGALYKNTASMFFEVLLKEDASCVSDT